MQVSNVDLLPAEMQSAIREGTLVASSSKQTATPASGRAGVHRGAAKLPMTKKLLERHVEDDHTLIPPASLGNSAQAAAGTGASEPIAKSSFEGSFLARTARTLNAALSAPTTSTGTGQHGAASAETDPSASILPSSRGRLPATAEPGAAPRPGPSSRKPVRAMTVATEAIDVTATPSRLSQLGKAASAGTATTAPASAAQAVTRSPGRALRLRITRLEAQNATMRLQLREALERARRAEEEVRHLQGEVLRARPAAHTAPRTKHESAGGATATNPASVDPASPAPAGSTTGGVATKPSQADEPSQADKPSQANKPSQVHPPALPSQTAEDEPAPAPAPEVAHVSSSELSSRVSRAQAVAEDAIRVMAEADMRWSRRAV
jgi:hypothetical protein